MANVISGIMNALKFGDLTISENDNILSTYHSGCTFLSSVESFVINLADRITIEIIINDIYNEDDCSTVVSSKENKINIYLNTLKDKNYYTDKIQILECPETKEKVFIELLVDKEYYITKEDMDTQINKVFYKISFE